MEATNTKVITGKVRFSYVNVFEPRAMEEGAKPKYSVVLLIPKKDTKTVKKIKDGIEAAYQAGKAKFGGKLPAKYWNPLRDGDEERPDDENYEGMYFVNAKSDRKPGIVDANRDEIMDNDEFYSGCWGRAAVTFYAFNASGTKGVACGLNNLQKQTEGDRLSGGSSAQDDFDDDDDDLM